MKFNKKKIRIMKEFEAKGIALDFKKPTVIQKSRAASVIQSNLDQVKYLSAKTGISPMTAKLVVGTYKRMGHGKKPSMKAMINYVQGDKIRQFLSNMGIEVKDLLADLLLHDSTITEDILLNPARWGTVGVYRVKGPFTSPNGTVVSFNWNYNTGSTYTITGGTNEED